MQEPTVIIIVGPTAVGKTAAAIRLAQSLHTKIISADSRQCYRELNIGVAKPSPEELGAVHHYFIDSHSIRQEVNAALFEELALQWTADIFRDQPNKDPSPNPNSSYDPAFHRKAVLVGGTGLYIKAFTEGLDDMPPIDPAIRRQVQEQYANNGLAGLQEEIRGLDPSWYATAEILNPQRLMRALEVRLSTGRSILSFHNRQRQPRPFRIRKIGLHLPKDALHRRIHDRVDQMMEQGLLEEVKGLLPYRTHKALQTVGYTELFDYLDGRTSLETAVEEIKKNTRHYAKRQMTWFRKDPSIEWVDPAAPLV